MARINSRIEKAERSWRERHDPKRMVTIWQDYRTKEYFLEDEKYADLDTLCQKKGIDREKDDLVIISWYGGCGVKEKKV